MAATTVWCLYLLQKDDHVDDVRHTADQADPASEDHEEGHLQLLPQGVADKDRPVVLCCTSHHTPSGGSCSRRDADDVVVAAGTGAEDVVRAIVVTMEIRTHRQPGGGQRGRHWSRVVFLTCGPSRVIDVWFL